MAASRLNVTVYIMLVVKEKFLKKLPDFRTNEDWPLYINSEYIYQI